MRARIGGARLLALQLGKRLECALASARAFQSLADAIDELDMSTRDDDNTTTRASERRAKLVKAGVAVGIGSAAIVAALLYASKVKKKPRT